MSDATCITVPQERTLAALSGGVDSSVAAALVASQGSEIDGITLGLWGGERESNSCSTADSSAANRVAKDLGIDHVVLDWTDDFNVEVVGGFVDGAASGLTKNPCITCNKTFKAERLFAWAEVNGYQRIVTGHYAQVVDTPWGKRIARGVDTHKDQSYVLCGFEPEQIDRLVLPLGAFTKAEVRNLARKFALNTADKNDSMGLCFSPRKVLATAALGNVAIVDGPSNKELSEIPVGVAAVGQRKGLGVSGFESARYVVDIHADKVVLGREQDLLRQRTMVDGWRWVGGTAPTVDGQMVELRFQSSAHGQPVAGALSDTLDLIDWEHPVKKIAPGQVIVAYANCATDGVDSDVVVGWGEAR